MAEDIDSTERGQTSPFERMYVNPGPDGKFDEEFARFYEGDFGGSREGAQKHFELLKKIPEGYRYFGKVPENEANERVKSDSMLEIVSGPVFDIDGKPLDGSVALAKKILPKNQH